MPEEVFLSTLIERLNARAHDPGRATDERRDGANGKPVRSVAAPSAGEDVIAAAETALGFRLPALLRQVYQEVGNGGFGPGYGLPGVSLSAAAADAGASVVGRYTAHQQAPGRLAWPTGLLPLCDWGGDIVSCVDCSRPDAPVIRLDPNMPKADVARRVPVGRHYDRADRISPACWVESPSLALWLDAWADGRPLFYMAYGGADEDGEDEDEDGDEEEGDDSV